MNEGFKRRHRAGVLGAVLPLAALSALCLVVVLSGCKKNSPGGDACGGCAPETYCCETKRACEAIRYNCVGAPTCAPGMDLSYPAGPYMDTRRCEPLPLQCACQESPPLEPGMIGKQASLTAGPASLMASAYESLYGDLLFLSADLSDLATQHREIVDGVPAGLATNAPSGYRHGISKKGDDVGLGNAIVADALGTPFISYHDATHQSLKLARRSGGEWSVHTVAAPTAGAGAPTEIVGRYSSIQIISGRPAIAFLVQNITEGDGRFRAELRWAMARSATPARTEDWEITPIDAEATSCRGLCPAGQACFVSEEGGGSACVAEGTGCTEVCATATACLEGTCAPTLEKLQYTDVPEAVALWPRAAITPAGAAVVYFDSVHGELKLARQDAQRTWTTTVIASRLNEKVGAFPAVAVDDAGLLHISYQNSTRDTLQYVQVDPENGTSLATETIDDGLRTNGVHPVGADSAIAFDITGAPIVLYQDQQLKVVLAAHRLGTSSWYPSNVSDPYLGRLVRGSPRGYGFANGLVSLGDRLHGASFYFDRTNTAGGAFEFFTLP